MRGVGFRTDRPAPSTDRLFALGLFGICVELVAGVALPFAALAGPFMMALMWIAGGPPAKHLSDSSASRSTNPLVDHHLIRAVILIALAATSVGDTFGLGRIRVELPLRSPRPTPEAPQKAPQVPSRAH